MRVCLSLDAFIITRLLTFILDNTVSFYTLTTTLAVSTACTVPTYELSLKVKIDI